MATDSSILAWETPWMEEPGVLFNPVNRTTHGVARVGRNLATKQQHNHLLSEK